MMQVPAFELELHDAWIFLLQGRRSIITLIGRYLYHLTFESTLFILDILLNVFLLSSTLTGQCMLHMSTSQPLVKMLNMLVNAWVNSSFSAKSLLG